MTLNDFRQHGKVTATRFIDAKYGVALYVAKTGNVWRVLADQDGVCSATGDFAKSKFECFTCVLPEVAKQWGITI